MFPVEIQTRLTRDNMLALYRVLQREYPPTAGLTDAHMAKLRRLSLAIALVAGLLAFVTYPFSPLAALLPAGIAIVFPIAGVSLPKNAMKQQQRAWERMVDHPYAHDLWKDFSLRFDEEGFHTHSADGEATFRWRVVRLITQDETHTYLVWALGTGLAIPHEHLPEGLSPEDFAAACRARAVNAAPAPGQ